MKKVIAIILSVMLVVSATSFAVSAYSIGEDGVPTCKEAIAQYEADEGVTVDTFRYYFLQPNGATGLKGKDPDKSYYQQFAPSWSYEGFTEAGPGVYWWDAEDCPNPTGWAGYGVDGQVEGTNVYYADVPQTVTMVLWNNGVDGGMDDTQEIYFKAAQSLNVGSEYYDPGESPYLPEGTENFDNMIWIPDPDNIAINEFSGKIGCGGFWFYYYGDECFGCVKDGESDLEHNCMNAAHHHGDEPQPTVLLGDADDDGDVTIMDATCIQKWLAGIFDDDQINVKNAAVTGEDEPDITCATCIQKFLAGISNIDGSIPYDENNPINPPV